MGKHAFAKAAVRILALAAAAATPILPGGSLALAGPPEAESDDGAWQALPAIQAEQEGWTRRFRLLTSRRPAEATFYRLSEKRIESVLARAPHEGAAGPMGRPSPVMLGVPLPNGRFAEFRIERVDVLAPALADRYPDIRVVRGTSVTGDGTVLWGVATADGFSGDIRGVGVSACVEPIGDGVYAAVARTSMARAERQFECEVAGRPDVERPAAPTMIQSGSVRRVYRLAVACTHQYAKAVGTTKKDVLAAIAKTVARVNSIFQEELAIRLQLVEDEEKVVFVDEDDDPLAAANGDADALIEMSQRVIDERIGDANYDIGHTFSTGAGGLARLACVCRSGMKAKGVTGSTAPKDDPFDVDYVAHEMGHQFGANHTFCSDGGGGCTSRTCNASTACEPGSGSTIMGYAGICGDQDLQLNSDPYFHAMSLQEILTNVTQGEGQHAFRTEGTGNTPPTITMGPDVRIPKGTPFRLRARAVDPDGQALSWCWEELDSGSVARLKAPDDGRIPLMRSMKPTPGETRVFPRVERLARGTYEPQEKLPELPRTLTFAATVRELGGSGGGLCIARRRVIVDPDAGPFLVDTPTPKTITTGVLDVRWQPAGTARLGADAVNILLSLDGGITFTTVLKHGVPNSGQCLVALPEGVTSTQARLLVESEDETFFNVCSQDFQIVAPEGPVVSLAPSDVDPTAGASTPAAAAARARAYLDLLVGLDPHEILVLDEPGAIERAKQVAAETGASIVVRKTEAELEKELQGARRGDRVLLVTPQAAGGKGRRSPAAEDGVLLQVGRDPGSPSTMKYRPPAGTGEQPERFR